MDKRSRCTPLEILIGRLVWCAYITCCPSGAECYTGQTRCSSRRTWSKAWDEGPSIELRDERCEHVYFSCMRVPSPNMDLFRCSPMRLPVL